MRPARRLGCLCAATLTALAAASTAAAADAPAPDPALRLVNLRVSGGESAWHADDDFRLDWDRPAGERSPRVIAVDYRVRDADGAVAVPRVRIEGDVGLLQHIEVPPVAGEYTAEVWLEGEEADGPPEQAVLRFDDTRPAATRPLVPTGWVRAGVPVPVRFELPAAPWPRSGIRGYAIAVDGGEGGEPCAGPDRCTAEETDLSLSAGEDSISLGPLAEGTSVVRAYAVSGSGMRSTVAAVGELRVDGTGPTVGLGPIAGGWSDRPVEVTAWASDEHSGMAANGASGARTAIAIDDGAPFVAPGPVARTVVHGDGVHRVSAYARDAVGNPSREPRSDDPPSAELVRIDEAPPRIAFAAQQNPAEPERIEATVADSLSGPDPARGTIGVRPLGGRGPYAPIPTVLSSGRLLAVWDSDSYPAGAYEFEARGYDAAGNRAVADRRAGGAPMVLVNPLKTATVLLTGFGGKRARVQTCRRSRDATHCHRRTVVPYARRPRRRSSRYGQAIVVGGRLSSRSASPLPAREIRVIESFDPGAAVSRRTTSVETAADGTFLAHLAPGPSRRIRIEFGGTPLLSRAHGRSLRLAVRAPVRLRSSSATATVGGAPIVFTGSVGHDDAEIPDSGLPVTLQFRLGQGPWTEFRTVQTDAGGRFHYPYAFSDDDSRGVRFQFRARVAPQPDWPYAAGVSLPVTVTGR